MELPEKLKYTASHEWVEDLGDGTVRVGITALATEQLGELVYVELPQPGAKLRKGDSCAVVESTKSASDVYTPLTGEIIEVNEILSASPNQVNNEPYGSGWLFKLKLTEKGELDDMLDSQAYRDSAGEKA